MKQNSNQMIRERKKHDESYLFELQKFLDTAENITDLEFRNRVITQMLRCDEALTKLIEEM